MQMLYRFQVNLYGVAFDNFKPFVDFAKL